MVVIVQIRNYDSCFLRIKSLHCYDFKYFEICSISYGSFHAIQEDFGKPASCYLKGPYPHTDFRRIVVKVRTNTPILARSGQEPAVESADSIT